MELEKIYTYQDYLNWDPEKRVELLNGRIVEFAAAPSRIHQLVTGNLFVAISNALKGTSCSVYVSPFDVRLARKQETIVEEVISVVQPDITIICDPTKLDDQGCNGAPDLVIEVLSPSTRLKDLTEKKKLYEESGVEDYWIVFAGDQVLEIYSLDERHKYRHVGTFTAEQTVSVLPGKAVQIALTDVFS